ncbi:hypothetical protein BDW22DRAFT_1361146 [Trametopsis cervina]|nr:hypothetical protein BDW22DRAFT_1361146 [Trametopsis cervina]
MPPTTSPSPLPPPPYQYPYRYIMSESEIQLGLLSGDQTAKPGSEYETTSDHEGASGSSVSRAESGAERQQNKQVDHNAILAAAVQLVQPSLSGAEIQFDNNRVVIHKPLEKLKMIFDFFKVIALLACVMVLFILYYMNKGQPPPL